MTKALDPLEMLLDAARFIGAEKPAWAMAAREAVQHARAQPPGAKEPSIDLMQRVWANLYFNDEDAGNTFQQTLNEVVDWLAARNALPPHDAALSVPPGDQAKEELQRMKANHKDVVKTKRRTDARLKITLAALQKIYDESTEDDISEIAGLAFHQATDETPRAARR